MEEFAAAAGGGKYWERRLARSCTCSGKEVAVAAGSCCCCNCHPHRCCCYCVLHTAVAAAAAAGSTAVVGAGAEDCVGAGLSGLPGPGRRRCVPWCSVGRPAARLVKTQQTIDRLEHMRYNRPHDMGRADMSKNRAQGLVTRGPLY